MASRLYDKGAVGDLVLLDNISENSILNVLRTRHQKELPYTNIGSVLLAVNPFKRINNMYSARQISTYKGRYVYENPPHIYALAEETYRSMLTEFEDQCVIISGESGAGKTESAKLIMQYIAAVSGSGKEIERVKNQLLQSNPVLESFGNAKTVRNDNSSRFGKYMTISFDYAGDPIGGRVINYLLEKSRVVQPAPSERSFHIFYQLTRGMKKKDRDTYYLQPPEFYNYLLQSNCYSVNTINDTDEYNETCEGLKALGVSAEQLSEVFYIVSAVLWIGQLDFTDADRSQVTDDNTLQSVAYLLGVDPEQLRKAVTSRTISSGAREEITSWLDRAKALYTRDALAKAVYSKLFDWIVARINKAIDINNVSAELRKDISTIGILDIYGFEIFERNSFEQFCINFVNEKLQQIFIEKTLKSEQEEYQREQIEWVPVSYFNNKIVCDLIEARPRGLMAFLDEECLLGKGTDEKFLTKITSNLGQHEHFELPHDHMRGARMDFVLKHYAGDVRYCVDGFIDKNKDLVWKDLVLLGESSQLSIMQEMFPAGTASAMGKKRPITAGKAFVTQVNALMQSLSECTPHYVRCIKPNSTKRAGVMEDDLTIHQIRYLGLLENVRVRRAGFAFRQSFDRFLRRYKMLSPSTWPMWQYDDKSGCETILRGMGMTAGSQYQLGTTKVFIRQPVSLFSLEELRERKLNDLVTLIQKVWRSYRARKYFLELRQKALGLFGDRKHRRRMSIRRYFVGDYKGLGEGDLRVANILTKNGDKRVIFSDDAKVLSKSLKQDKRMIILTDKALYISSANKFTVKRRIALNNIQSASLSPYADNFCCLSIPTEWDLAFELDRKTELLTALVDRYKEVFQRELQLNFVERITFHPDTGFFSKKRDEKARTIVFSKGASHEGVVSSASANDPKGTYNVSVGNVEVVNAHTLQNYAPKKMTVGNKGRPKRTGSYQRDRVGSHNRGISLGNTNNFQKAAYTHDNHANNNMNTVYEAKRPEPPARYKPALPQRPVEVWVRALYDFQGRDEQELSFPAGSEMRLLKKEDDGWWSVDWNGKLGYVPKTYVEIIEPTTTTPRTHKPLPRPKYVR